VSREDLDLVGVIARESAQVTQTFPSFRSVDLE
jgi:hypothetical protein